PVGARRQRLRLRDELLLGGLGGGVALLELREVVPALAVERGPRVAEALPERLLARPVDTRARALRLLPALEQGAQLLARGAPLHAARVGRGDLLRGLDDLGTRRERGGLGGGALRLELAAALRRGTAQRVDPRPQPVEVAHRGRLRGLLREARERLVDLLDGQVRAREAGLEERDLRLQVEVAAHVQRERLLGADAGELADGALARLLADVDGAVLVHAAERRGGLRRGGVVRERRDDGHLGRGRRRGRGARGGGRLARRVRGRRRLRPRAGPGGRGPRRRRGGRGVALGRRVLRRGGGSLGRRRLRHLGLRGVLGGRLGLRGVLSGCRGLRGVLGGRVGRGLGRRGVHGLGRGGRVVVGGDRRCLVGRHRLGGALGGRGGVLRRRRLGGGVGRVGRR